MNKQKTVLKRHTHKGCCEPFPFSKPSGLCRRLKSPLVPPGGIKGVTRAGDTFRTSISDVLWHRLSTEAEGKEKALDDKDGLYVRP